MLNISLNKEPIYLKSGQLYIVIDSLYVDAVRKHLPELDDSKIFVEILSKVFIYNDIPFCKFQADCYEFDIRRIKKIYYDEISKNDTTAFENDSPILMFINEAIFISVTKSFDYFKFLCNEEDEGIDLKYWAKFVEPFDPEDIGAIVSPGINEGADFEGSGTHIIV